MVIGPEHVDDIRRVLGDGEIVNATGVTRVSLGAAFELACAYRSLVPEVPSHTRSFIEALATAHPVLRTAIDALAGETIVAPATYGTPIEEVRFVDPDLGSPSWGAFVQRFKRALELHGGVPTQKALALAKVIDELADNVVQHSGSAGGGPAAGIAGYVIRDGGFVLAVADTGRGAFQSLRDSPTWRERVQTPREALRSVVLEHASRRPASESGEGIRQIQRVIVDDLRGVVSFRSDDSRLTISGEGMAREVKQGSSPTLSGVQAFVSCLTHWNYG